MVSKSEVDSFVTAPEDQPSPDNFLRADELEKHELPGGFVAFPCDEGKPILMKIAESKYETIGDWLGYVGGDKPEEEKSAEQKEAEEIMHTEVIPLNYITEEDLPAIRAHSIDLSLYQTKRIDNPSEG